jgi:hypothetical protein
MNLSSKARQAFRQAGARGGLRRAERLPPETRRTIAAVAALRRWTRARFGDSSFAALKFPGGDQIDTGLIDLAAGRETRESFMVALAAPRLRREGVPVPNRRIPDADHRLYRLLETTEGALAHARYLACLRQLESFADACRMHRERHSSPGR